MVESIAYRNQRFLKSTPNDLTQKKNDFMVNLRKKKRFNASKQIREYHFKLYSENFESGRQIIPNDQSQDFLVETTWLEDLENLDINSPLPDIYEILKSLKTTILNKNSALALLITSGSLNFLLRLPNSADPTIKYEIFQILTSISTIKSKELLNSCPDQIFLIILSYTQENSDEILKKTLDSLIAFICVSQHFFEVFQTQKLFPRLLNILQKFRTLEIYQKITELCLVLADYDSLLTDYEVFLLLEILQEAVLFDEFHVKNLGILALGHLVRSDSTKIEQFMEHEIFEIVFKWWETPELRENTIKTLANLTSGTFKQTQKILDLGLLDIYLSLLNLEVLESLSYIYFSLSNIAAGSSSQLYQLVLHPVFELALGKMAELDENGKVEASFFVRNVLKLAGKDLKIHVFEMGICEKVSSMMEIGDAQGLLNFLAVFEEFLKVYGKDLFYSLGFGAVVEQLQRHKNPEIYMKCVCILEY